MRTSPHPHAGSSSGLPAAHPHLAALLEKLNSWRQNAQSRKHLAQMSEHDLADLAISPSERYVEISKPFWRCAAGDVAHSWLVSALTRPRGCGRLR
ncbi:DUF1127 domain-containing protein [Pseudomonas aeruginosa]|nr:DUF1127 domain-containing protein [Pseudomonas aeruginosa]MBG4055157.1 DUF1127 domain-containing protein [Pseudomonas aeruginosa]